MLVFHRPDSDEPKVPISFILTRTKFVEIL